MFRYLLSLLTRPFQPDPFAHLTPGLARDIGLEGAGLPRVELTILELRRV